MLKRVVSALIFWLFTYISLPLQAVPQNTQASTQPSNEINDSQTEYSPLTQLGNKYQNGIKLLQNRFRIDYEVDEITMIFFREYGSAPVVLVRPDGSKLFQSNADSENIFWFDSNTYDMIRIKKPMPGPWQAVGKVSPESRVMVLSDLVLKAEALPNIIFSGEIIKQTAYLTNNGVPIDYTAFRDVVELSISLASTNNPDFNNFGARTETVAVFEDNGRGMDERPLDGVFTGQFNLTVADGEWSPTFIVSTPMYTREQIDPNLTLLPNPIKMGVELDGGGAGYHKLSVDAQREYVDISTLLIDGKIRFPNGDIQNFSITEMSPEAREHLIVNSEYGVYRVKLTTYGNTVDGREFILDVPEYSFLSEEPVIAAVETTGIVAPATADGAIQENTLTEQETPEAEEKMSTSTLVSIIVGINLFILIVGGGLIWYLTSQEKPSFNFMKRSKTPSDEEVADKKENFLARIFKRKPKEVAAEDPLPGNAESDPEFMNLSIPKE